MLSKETRVGKYDLARFDLHGAISKMFNGVELGNVHQQLETELPRLEVRKDQKTPLHERVYAEFDSFRDLYLSFVRHIAQQEWGSTDVVYQRVPTFRFQVPGNVGVGEFHTDGKYGHADGEVNVWVPLVDAVETRALKIEDDYGSGNFESVPVRYGEYLIFDGVNLQHGNVINETDLTRASFDFRVASAADFVPSEDRSISAGMRFDLNEYFDVLAPS